VAKRARRRVATRAGRQRVKTTLTSRGVEITPTANRVEVDLDVVVPSGKRASCAFC